MSTSLTVKPSTTGRTMIEFPQTRNIFEDFEALIQCNHPTRFWILSTAWRRRWPRFG